MRLRSVPPLLALSLCLSGLAQPCAAQDEAREWPSSARAPLGRPIPVMESEPDVGQLASGVAALFGGYLMSVGLAVNALGDPGIRVGPGPMGLDSGCHDIVGGLGWIPVLGGLGVAIAAGACERTSLWLPEEDLRIADQAMWITIGVASTVLQGLGILLVALGADERDVAVYCDPTLCVGLGPGGLFAHGTF